MELASFGPWLWWCRCNFLGEMGLSRRALVLGDGDGRFTARLLQTNPTVRIDAIDASPAMLRTLIGHAGPECARVQTQLADVRSWQPAGPATESGQNLPYDLVVTHFFLDCLTSIEVRALAATLHAAVSPSARWVVSEFAVPESWLGRWVARPVVWGLYCAFGWLTGLKVRQLPDHSTALQEAGFSLEMRRAWLGGLLTSELWGATLADSAPGPQSAGANSHSKC
jgi:SAM-dependent methyltransferase